mmetsp:Transcript_13951/g.22770  ORF Transcript_13951/g.22770 Transcript_13951/m.22770 type:complete len:243 (+) Transcript_13951:138-866(+)
MRTALSRKRITPGSPKLADIDNIDEESLLRQRHDSKPSNSRSSASPANVLLNRIRLISARDNQGHEGVIGLLQDIVGGIMLGTVGMSILLLLDYSNIINLETARVFRKTASTVFNAPDVISNIQMGIEKKLMSMDVYNSFKKELSDSQAVIANEQKFFQARSRKVTSLKAELRPLRDEYDELIRKSGLGVFCPDCKWGMGMDCQQRVNYMMENYSDSATVIGCIAKLVNEGKTKNGKCLKTE